MYSGSIDAIHVVESTPVSVVFSLMFSVLLARALSLRRLPSVFQLFLISYTSDPEKVRLFEMDLKDNGTRYLGKIFI